MRLLSRTLVPGAAGSSVVASLLMTFVTSWVMNHFCAVANGVRIAACRLAMSIGELYWPQGGVVFAWYVVCDRPRWCDPGAFAKAKLKSQVANIGIRPMMGAALQIIACATSSSCAAKRSWKFF